jgi:hypothetical protein
MGWKAVMKGGVNEKAIHNIIEVITTKLINEDSSKDPSLFSGILGKSIYFSSLNKYNKNNQFDNKLLEPIEVWDLFLKTGNVPKSFSAGVYGYIFYLSYLCKNEFLEKEDIEDITNQLISWSVNFSLKEMEQDHFDYLHGSLGLVVALSQIGDISNNLSTEDYITKITSLLETKQSFLNENSILWKSRHHINTSTFIFNLGLAHGSPSVVNVLLILLEHSEYPQLIKQLILKGINGILEQEYLDKDNTSLFPTHVNTESMEKMGPSRMAWCYGDLGIAITLIKSGLSLNNKEWINKGIEIGMHTISRINLEENNIIDSGLCHGMSGIALIYSRLYNYTDVNEFKVCAMYWYEKTIESAFDKKGRLKYKTWDEMDGCFKFDTGFLEGISGIGLSLISSISDEEPTWDNCLLLS